MNAVDEARDFHLELPSHTKAVGSARRWVEAVADPLPEPLVDDLRLLINELITNSIIHAAGSHIWLQVSLRPGVVRAEVWDQGKALSGPRMRAATLDDQSGRGLALVSCLSDRWGVSCMGHNGVWFEIDCP